MKKLLLIPLLFISCLAFGQLSNFLNINNIRASVSPDGFLFNHAFTVPADSSTRTIISSALWIGGLDINGDLHVAGQRLPDNGADYSYGPVADDYTSNEYVLRYNRVWKIDRDSINYHIANYSMPSYTVPEAIASWPGNGNTLNGETAVMAPYEDANQNGLYDPGNGDYPMVRGDQAIFFILNDDNFNHTASGGTRLKIEIHGMVYAFSGTDAADSTIFVNFQIINKSSNPYHSVYIGDWTDTDIGNPADDYIAFNKQLNMFYGYNGDEDDDTPAGYGTNPPAQGTMLLNRSASKCIFFSPQAAAYATPPNAADGYYNYLQSIWLDGTMLSYGANGYGAGNAPVDFMFPAYSDTGGGPNGLPPWSLDGSGHPGTDFQGVMSIGPLTFNPGEVICVDLAYPYARASSGGRLASVDLLFQNAELIQSFYDSQEYNCEFQVGINEPLKDQDGIGIYPNPSNGTFTIKTNVPVGSALVYIYDIVGKKVFESKISGDLMEINSKLNDGIYTVVMLNKSGEKKCAKMVCRRN